MQLEKHLTKDRILHLYMNVVEFGTGIFGAEAASRYYFDKRAANLSPLEASQLAASLPRPSSWNPNSTSGGLLGLTWIACGTECGKPNFWTVTSQARPSHQTLLFGAGDAGNDGFSR